MRTGRIVGWSGLLIVVTAGCGLFDTEPAEIEWELQPGVVFFYNEPVHIVIPDTIEVGVFTEVTVRTFGNGCVRQGNVEVMASEGQATIQPHDSVVRPTPDLACTDELRVFDHVAVVRFPQVGVATVKVVGERDPEGILDEIDRTVVVVDGAAAHHD